jgi:uncharacterized membrane protein
MVPNNTSNVQISSAPAQAPPLPGQPFGGFQPPAAPGALRLAERLGDVSALDTPAKALSAIAGALPARLRDALSGRSWLGHPLHPAATDVPIGAWMSASILDLLGGDRSARAADGLVAIGAASALPTAASGLVEWSEIQEPRTRRIGVVHAAANNIALGLYVSSLAARLQGRRSRGVLFALGGLAVMSIGGFLGGHLAYGHGIGVAPEATR